MYYYTKQKLQLDFTEKEYLQNYALENLLIILRSKTKEKWQQQDEETDRHCEPQPDCKIQAHNPE